MNKIQNKNNKKCYVALLESKCVPQQRSVCRHTPLPPLSAIWQGFAMQHCTSAGADSQPVVPFADELGALTPVHTLVFSQKPD